MLFQIRSYFKFLWKSTNQHGIHSPFVFDLVAKCLYDREKKPSYLILKKFRKSLLQNGNIIEVTDFGAGSKIFKIDSRKISSIAKNAGLSVTRAQTLYRICQYFKPTNVLEIGTSLGLATSAMSLGNSKATIFTLEGCPETAAIAKQQFKDFGFDNINVIVGEFGAFLDNQNKNFDLVYFDGNHQKEATLKYFSQLLPATKNETVWIFDDIHWSAEMHQAWNIIKSNLRVTVTIDNFQWGFVFFRKEQEKEHFIIR